MTSEREGLSDLEAQIGVLENLNLAGLRAVWRSHWGGNPKLRSADLFRRIIAWRMQAAVLGGLSQETRKLLTASSIPPTPLPKPGTRLTREYRGVLHTVEIAATEVRYGGRSFRSLTAVAKEITGTHWNGPKFFGLRGSQL